MDRDHLKSVLVQGFDAALSHPWLSGMTHEAQVVAMGCRGAIVHPTEGPKILNLLLPFIGDMDAAKPSTESRPG